MKLLLAYLLPGRRYYTLEKSSVSSPLQTFWISSRILRCMSYFQISSQCFYTLMKYCLLFEINLSNKKNVFLFYFLDVLLSFEWNSWLQGDHKVCQNCIQHVIFTTLFFMFGNVIQQYLSGLKCDMKVYWYWNLYLLEDLQFMNAVITPRANSALQILKNTDQCYSFVLTSFTTFLAVQRSIL